MRKNYTNYAFILCCLSLSVLLASCSSYLKNDDAVRINKDKTSKYNINPNTKTPRNGNALRGEVLGIEYLAVPDSCPINDSTKFIKTGYVLFIDSSNTSKKDIERIPLEDVDAVAKNVDMPVNEYGNVNYFENYNNPLLPKNLREVPVNTVYQDTCSTPCPCEKLNLDIEMPCILCFDCPKRELKWWFVDLKPGFATYKDVNADGEKVGKNDWTFDAAAGVRFGSSKRWGLGLIFSTGVKLYNTWDSTNSKRMSLNLYGRYDLIRNKERINKSRKLTDTLPEISEMMVYDTIKTKTMDGCGDSVIIRKSIKPSEIIKYRERIEQEFKEIEVRPCPNPYIYGLFGASIDEFSIDLFKLNGSECKNSIEWAGADVSMPLNFGFGVGLEFPLGLDVDLAADLGFRSISYGDKEVISGMLAPVNRRLNAIVFRLGITF